MKVFEQLSCKVMLKHMKDLLEYAQSEIVPCLIDVLTSVCTIK